MPDVNPFAKFAGPAVISADNPFAAFAPPDASLAPTDAGDGREVTLEAPANPASPVAPPPDPVAQAADARVAEEGKAHPLIRAADDIVRNLARGTPVGSWVDEIAAKGNAGLDKISGGMFGEPYETGVAYQRARDRAADNNATKVGELPIIGDVTTGGLTKLAGGIASLPAAPFLKVAKGATLLPKIVNGIANGVGYGGVYGAGLGDDTPSRVQHAKEGAALGGILGPLAEVVSSGAGNLAKSIGEFRPLPSPLKGYSRRAVDYVSKDYAADFNAPGATSYPQKAADLGPNSMLADMGPALREQLGGLATKPQVNAPIVRAIEGRASGAEQRLDTSINRAAGPPVNVPQMIEQMTIAKQAAAAPLYRRFYNTTIKPSDELVSILHAVPQEAYAAAQKIMQAERLDPNKIGNTGQMLDLIKRGLDKTVQDNSDAFGRVNNVGRVYAKLAKQLTTETDRILSPRDPTSSPWALARKTAGEHLRLKESFEDGQKAFDKKLSADQMAHDMRKMSPEERQMYRTGARQQIRAAAENASTGSGANPDTAERRILSSRNAEKKVSLIAHSPPAGRALNRTVRQEIEFANTESEVLRNSKSASRIEQGKRYPLDQSDRPTAVTFEQVIFGSVRKITDALLGGVLTEARIKTASHAADMLIAQGARRDTIVQGLRAYLKGQSLNTRQRVAVTRILNRVLHGSRGALIDARSNRQTTRASQ